MIDPSEHDSEDNITFSDIKDLSFTDIFILQYMQRFQGPIVRIALLNALNAFMKNDDMSPSSFYNRLKRLKKKGFISVENDRSRDQMIAITPRAHQALSRISILSITGSIDFHQHAVEIIPKVIEVLPDLKDRAEKLLIINLEEGLDVGTFEEFTQFANMVYIASENEIHNRFIKNESNDKISQSVIEDDIIREPNEWFDRVLIIGLECNTNQRDDLHWLKEAVRLVKSNGLVIITSLAELPNSDHFILNHLVNDLKHNSYTKFSSSQELKQSLKELGLREIALKNFTGQLIGWGRKN